MAQRTSRRASWDRFIMTVLLRSTILWPWTQARGRVLIHRPARRQEYQEPGRAPAGKMYRVIMDPSSRRRGSSAIRRRQQGIAREQFPLRDWAGRLSIPTQGTFW